MAILETWRNLAYGDGLDEKKREELWTAYFQIEKGIYEQILSDPTQVIEGTVKELSECCPTAEVRKASLPLLLPCCNTAFPGQFQF